MYLTVKLSTAFITAKLGAQFSQESLDVIKRAFNLLEGVNQGHWQLLLQAPG